jgi:2-polyprenyl-6-methoxyphenol hydroxylase-like FAD-dependent oxidoreductase
MHGHAHDESAAPAAEGATRMQQPSSREPLSIGIIGGGIGGIALAVACQRISNGEFQATVFEKDESFNARSQGYGLTVQQVHRTERNCLLKQSWPRAKSNPFRNIQCLTVKKKGSFCGFSL